jgi:hypothetical protein
MKTLCLLCSCLLAISCGEKGRMVRTHDNPDSPAGEKPVPLPGDATSQHWSGPSSGKSADTVPDPVTGTPTQSPNP